MAKKEMKLTKLFLTDRALQKSDNDQFGHNDYSSLLEKLIREQPTPFNIGVFGKWGVGKSSIMNLLKERFKSDKNRFKFIDINVWKYDEVSLQRKFIVNIAEQLGLSKDLDEINNEIYNDREYETALLNYKDIVRTFFGKRSVALWLLIGSLVFLILFRIINIINVENHLINKIFRSAEDLVSIPLFISVIFWIKEIIQKARLKFKIGKFDSHEQFEKKFIDLIKRDKSKKIIFIDDLDRCSKEKVVKTLETIKTFLDVESCIFVIACDDEIIKKAVNKAHELYNENGVNEGADYLEKFFQYTLRIPPFTVVDMRKYIHNILDKNNSGLIELGQVLDDIIFIIINKNIKSPRNAITSINEFTTSYILANEREQNKKSKLPDKKITGNLSVLAVVVSIKLNFPEFYQDLLAYPNLIFWIRSIIEGEKEILDDTQLEICSKYYRQTGEIHENLRAEDDWTLGKTEEYKNLLDFIESIKEFLTIDDIAPFLYLGVDETSYLIGDKNLKELYDSLRNGVETRVSKILDEADAEKKEYMFDHICDLIEYKLERVELRKALQILSTQLHKCPESKMRRTAMVFKSKFYKRTILYNEFVKFNPKGIFTCARNLSSGKNQHDILKLAIEFLEENSDEYIQEILVEIFENEDIVTNRKLIDKIVTKIDETNFKSQTENNEELQYCDFVKENLIKYKENQSVIKKFFSGEIVEKIVSKLIEIDGNADEEDEDYQEMVLLFEILKKHVLDEDIDRLCNHYETLIQTRLYDSAILIDIEKRKEDIPKNRLQTLSLEMLKFIELYEDEVYIGSVFGIVEFWFNNFEDINDEKVTAIISNKLLELAANDDVSILDISITYFEAFHRLFNETQVIALFDKYISLIHPLNQPEKANKISELIVAYKENLLPENRKSLVAQIILELNTKEGLINDQSYDFWTSLFEILTENFEEGELDNLIKPNNSQFILNVSFANVTNDIRARYCSLIIKGFAKIGKTKQNEFFELFRAFLSSRTVDNSKYSIENIFPLRQYLIGTSFSTNSAPLFIQQFDLGIEPVTKLKNVKILFELLNNLTDQQKHKVFGEFEVNADSEPGNSVGLLLSKWQLVPNSYKYQAIKNLLPTMILNEGQLKDALVGEIVSGVKNIQDAEKLISSISILEDEFKNTEQERDFYALIIASIKLGISAEFEFITQLKADRVKEIKSESDIDLCRNKLSTIISMKDDEYDKDREVNDLFFNLLSDSIEKKKLAIDVFEYYYEGRHPYHRKGTLVEHFDNLMEELDGEYKHKLKHLAKKYDLKVKKSFWGSFFGS